MIRCGTAGHRLGIGLASAAVLALTACGAPGAQSDGEAEAVTPTPPSSPINLTLLDGAGNVTVNRPIYDNFAAAHPELVASIDYQSAPAPDVAGKVRAQQLAGQMDISVVIGGTDVLGAAQTEDLVLPLLPEFASSLPDLAQVQGQGSTDMQALADGVGIVNRYNPAGPLLAHQPDVLDVPSTPEELLAWAREHPGGFTYAQPPNSGPGRTFMMSLPYMLGDSDPSDPENGWDKTWAYLRELGRYVESYPPSSTIMNQQFGSGQLQLIPTILSMDINSRRDGTWAPETQVALFGDQHWITDAHYMMVPKGVSPEQLHVALELVKWTLRPDQQALTYDTGSLITANKNVTPTDASPEGKALLQEWGRPDFYSQALDTGQTHTPLTPENQVKAFEIWQREVGSNVGS